MVSEGRTSGRGSGEYLPVSHVEVEVVRRRDGNGGELGLFLFYFPASVVFLFGFERLADFPEHQRH